MPRQVHKLDLYRLAVQHPLAEAAFLARCYRHYFKDEPTRLREDFAGTAAVAAAWAMQHEDNRALAVEKHGPTARWAQQYVRRELRERAEDALIVEADVLDLATPRVDVVAALNFSTLIWHDRPALLRYLRHARKCLDRQGVMVLDVFGGPGAMTPGNQRRDVQSDEGNVPGFTYTWEQAAFDHASQRISCHIHFDLPGKRQLQRAFTYDWRLWSLPELAEAMREAGFDDAQVWADDPNRPGRYRPVRRLPATRDFVAYVVGVRRGRG